MSPSCGKNPALLGKLSETNCSRNSRNKTQQDSNNPNAGQVINTHTTLIKDCLLHLVADRSLVLYFLPFALQHQCENISQASWQSLKIALREDSTLPSLSHSPLRAARQVGRAGVVDVSQSHNSASGTWSSCSLASHETLIQWIMASPHCKPRGTQRWHGRSGCGESASHKAPPQQGMKSTSHKGDSASFKQLKAVLDASLNVMKRQHHIADIEWPLWHASKGSQASFQQDEDSFKVNLIVVTN